MPKVRLSGQTTLYGKCVRVGGVDPKAEMRLSDGVTKLTFTVSEANAKKLARKLYDEVAVEGIATWDAETLVIQDFRATDILDYEPTSPLQAFQELAVASAGRWNGVDADEFVRRIRGESEDAQ